MRLFRRRPVVNGEPLTIDEFRVEFRRLWQAVRRRFFKLEYLQSYQEPDDPSYLSFTRGDLTAAAKHLDQRHAAQAAFYEAMVRRDIHFVRVHAVHMPLSPYLQYEFISYEITARYGERILIADPTKLRNRRPPYTDGDFLLFDDEVVLRHDYTDDGLLRGGWLVTKKREVKRYVDAASDYLSASVPFESFRRISLKP